MALKKYMPLLALVVIIALQYGIDSFIDLGLTQNKPKA
jgi:hypothetical protein